MYFFLICFILVFKFFFMCFCRFLIVCVIWFEEIFNMIEIKDCISLILVGFVLLFVSVWLSRNMLFDKVLYIWFWGMVIFGCFKEVYICFLFLIGLRILILIMLIMYIILFEVENRNVKILRCWNYFS